MCDFRLPKGCRRGYRSCESGGGHAETRAGRDAGVPAGPRAEELRARRRDQAEKCVRGEHVGQAPLSTTSSGREKVREDMERAAESAGRRRQWARRGSMGAGVGNEMQQ